MTASTRTITLLAGSFGFLGVALGAFGAHGLKDMLEARQSLGTWQTAVLYQLVHAVALLALAGWRDAHAGPNLKAAWCWSVGVVLFSGSIYWLALGGPKFLGPVTPLGGVAFLLGWVFVAWGSLKPTPAA